MFQQQQEFPEADPILAKALQAFLAEKPQGATAYEISTDYNRIVREHKMVQDQLLNYPFDRSISFDDEYFVTSFSVLARVSGYEQKVGLRNAELIREFAKQAEKKFAPEDFYPENPKLRREFIYFMIENGLEDEEREKLGIDIRPGTLEREARLRVLAALEKAGVIPNAKDPVFLQQVEEEKNKMLAEIMSQAPEKVRQLAPEYAASERGRAHQDYLHLFLKYRDLASGNPFARRTSASALQAYSTLFAVLREHNPEAAGRIAADDALIRQGFGMRGPAYDRYYVTEDDLRSVGYPIPARYDARGNRLPREATDSYRVGLDLWPGQAPAEQTEIDVAKAQYMALERLQQLDGTLFECLCAIDEQAVRAGDIPPATVQQRQREAYNQVWMLFHEIKDDIERCARVTAARSVMFGSDGSNPLSGEELQAFALLQEKHRLENAAILQQRSEQQTRAFPLDRSVSAADPLVEIPPTKWIVEGFDQAVKDPRFTFKQPEFLLQNAGRTVSPRELDAAARACGDAAYQRAVALDETLQRELSGYQRLFTQFDHIGSRAHETFDVSFDGVLHRTERKGSDGKVYYDYVASDMITEHLAEKWHETALALNRAIQGNPENTPEALSRRNEEHAKANPGHAERIRQSYEEFRKKYPRYFPPPLPD